MRDREDRCRRNVRMGNQSVVDFRRRYLLAPAIDDVLDTACQVEEAVRIEIAFVASAQPSIDKGLRISKDLSPSLLINL